MGVELRDTIVSAIGQADDTVLLSNNIYDVNNLLSLTFDFCSKYQVELCPEKTSFFNKKKLPLYSISEGYLPYYDWHHLYTILRMC